MARPTVRCGPARSILAVAAVAAATLLAISGPMPQRAHAATFTVTVGPSGMLTFVDATSGTSTTTIHVGDTVTWNWASSFHSSCSGNSCVPATSPANVVEPWSSGVQNAGFMFPHTFNTAGTYTYECTVHVGLGMIGTVVVLPAPPSVGGIAEEPQLLTSSAAGERIGNGTNYLPYVAGAALVGALAAGGAWGMLRQRRRA